MTLTSDRDMGDVPGAATAAPPAAEPIGSFEVIGGAPGEPPEQHEVPDLWDDDDDDEVAEPHIVRIPVSSVTALSAAVVVVGLLLAIWVISRNGSDAASDPRTAAPVTTAAAAAPATAAAAPTTVAVAAAPTTAVAAAPTTVAAAAPTTVATAAPSTEAFCKGVTDYSLTSLVILGQRAVADPQGVYVAFEAMVRNAPAAIAPAVEQLRPLTTQVRDEIVAGHITTPEALRTWLADKAHWPAEAEWLKASQQILPVVAASCPA